MVSGTVADCIIANAFGMHSEFLLFRDHRIDAVEQTFVERRKRIGRAGLLSRSSESSIANFGGNRTTIVS